MLFMKRDRLLSFITQLCLPKPINVDNNISSKDIIQNNVTKTPKLKIDHFKARKETFNKSSNYS